MPRGDVADDGGQFVRHGRFPLVSAANRGDCGGEHHRTESEQHGGGEESGEEFGAGVHRGFPCCPLPYTPSIGQRGGEP